MWQKILEWAKYLLKQKEQTERIAADIEEQERTIKELTFFVQQQAYELQRQRENATHDREKLTLQLENILLRSERGLLTIKSTGGTTNEEFLRLIEELKQENEELRRRLRDLENQ